MPIDYSPHAPEGREFLGLCRGFEGWVNRSRAARLGNVGMMRPIERWRVGKALVGDAREAERIVREHYPAVLRLLVHMTGHSDDARDLAQKTFVRAHEALPRFRFDCPLRNWLLRIAVRECLHWRRDARPTLPLDESLAHRPPDHLALYEALAALPVSLREPFLVRNVEGLSTREAAELLAIPEGTVKSRCHAARARLRAALSESPPPARGERPRSHEATHENT